MFLLHQILGLASGLVVAVVCLTGALLVFETEIVSEMHPERSHVAVGTTRLDADALVASAVRNSGGTPEVVTAYRDPAYALKVVMSNGAQVYVDPYTARVVETHLGGERFFEVTEAIHRRLLAGETAVAMETELRGMSNAKAKRELGWQPAHSTWRPGFAP